MTLLNPSLFLIIPCLGLMYQLTLKTLVNSYSNYRSCNMLLIIHLTLPSQTLVYSNNLSFKLSCNIICFSSIKTILNVKVEGCMSEGSEIRHSWRMCSKFQTKYLIIRLSRLHILYNPLPSASITFHLLPSAASGRSLQPAPSRTGVHSKASPLCAPHITQTYIRGKAYLLSVSPKLLQRKVV